MLRTRSVIASLVALATLGGVAVTPALAGYLVELSSDIDCDATTGEWVVTYTFRADVSTSEITGTYLLSGGPSGEAGELTFVPPAVDQDEPSTATIRLPGDSTGLLVGAAVDGKSVGDDVEDQLDGTCLATPASTTTTTTAPEAPVAVEARPAFTG